MLASVRDRRESGAIAQLGERCNGIAEVRGSIPLGSTKSRRQVIQKGRRVAPPAFSLCPRRGRQRAQ